MKRIAFAFVFCALTVLLGAQLSPFSSTMFTFHDETQAARVAQFSQNIQNLHIPPRMAPEFSFGMGYPVFNFYAPFAYWITSGINLIGFSTLAALKLSFLLALLAGFSGMFLFLRDRFSFESALFGATLLVTSLFVPVEIFVRGNLAEIWYLGLVPWVFFLISRNARATSRLIYGATIAILFFIFTVHNIFSLLSIPLFLAYILLFDKKKRNIAAFVQSGLLAAYFIIPALLESGLTYASLIAKQTQFSDHFLCVRQLWSVPSGGWGYGGSVAGCLYDGMSFSLGKPQLILGALGILTFLMLIMRKKDSPRLNVLSKNRVSLFILIISASALFLTLKESQIIWNLLSPLFSLFQFPWRFLLFGIFGCAYFGALFTHAIQGRFITVPERTWIGIFVGASLIMTVSVFTYFRGQSMPATLYESTYLSRNYIHNSVAYKIPEYLPKTADYEAWRSLEGSQDVSYSEGLFEKHTLNIHYFPFWHIDVNGETVEPNTFDELGRPLLTSDPTAKLLVTYRQSSIEQLGNGITLLTAGFVLGTLLYKPLWKKFKALN